jgi:hypothetical protein
LPYWRVANVRCGWIADLQAEAGTVKPGSRRISKNGGTLEKAAQMANHASTRTTQLYDRRREELSLDEVERIRV